MFYKIDTLIFVDGWNLFFKNFNCRSIFGNKLECFITAWDFGTLGKCLQRDRSVICNVTKMTPFRGQASWAKMMSPPGKLTALACHLTNRVNKAEELTYLSTNIAPGQAKLQPTFERVGFKTCNKHLVCIVVLVKDTLAYYLKKVNDSNIKTYIFC